MSVIQRAIDEIEELHKSCSNTNPRRCARSHQQIINDLLAYESVIERNVRAEVAGDLEELRDDWVIKKEVVIGNAVYWLKEGFDSSIRRIEQYDMD